MPPAATRPVAPLPSRPVSSPRLRDAVAALLFVRAGPRSRPSNRWFRRRWLAPQAEPAPHRRPRARHALRFFSFVFSPLLPYRASIRRSLTWPEPRAAEIRERPQNVDHRSFQFAFKCAAKPLVEASVVFLPVGRTEASLHKIGVRCRFLTTYAGRRNDVTNLRSDRWGG